MQCHEVDYEIFGDDMQIVEVELDPGETVIAEAGAMNYMEQGIDFEARMGDGSQPQQGMFGKLKRPTGLALRSQSFFRHLFVFLRLPTSRLPKQEAKHQNRLR